MLAIDLEQVCFDKCERNQRLYGGTAGRKLGVYYNEGNYMLKFPGKAEINRGIEGSIQISNSPVYEYIGSKIYEILGMEVQQTILGTRNGKPVVACKDFLEDGDRLYEFDKIMATREPEKNGSSWEETNCAGTDLDEVLSVIKGHPVFAEIEGAELFFWKMFVVDAWIGNQRNNRDWGIVIKADGTKHLAPVYDNGNCFRCDWDDQEIQEVLAEEQKISLEAFGGWESVYERKGKKVNPYQLITKREYEGCCQAIQQIVPEMFVRMQEIENLIDRMPFITSVHKRFCKVMLDRRFEKILMPVYEEMWEERSRIHTKS